MAKVKYHIDIHGKPALCKASKNCPRGGKKDHWPTQEQAQKAADRRNEKLVTETVVKKDDVVEKELTTQKKEYKLNIQLDGDAPVKYGTTKTELTKIAKVGDILKTKSYNKRLIRLNDELGKIIERDIPRAHKQLVAIQKKQGQKPTPFEKFSKDFMKNDEDFKLLKAKKEELQKDILQLKNQRDQSVQIMKETKHNLLNQSYSKASGSTYLLYKADSLEETVYYFEQKGYTIEVRSDIKSALEENFLLRISDHYPKNYLRDEVEEKDPFNYTDASILVFFKEDDNPVRNTHGNAMQAIRDIEKLDKNVLWMK